MPTPGIRKLSAFASRPDARDFYPMLHFVRMGETRISSTWTVAEHGHDKHARELLEDETLTIKAIAARVGVDSPAYFCKLFKRDTGLSPLAYREKHVRAFRRL